MAERCVKGDYIGFTFGGVHSSELGLMRVSNGSRYEQDLLPPLQDKTAQVNGRDGVVYFGSQYNTKPIKVPVAFDNMTEESFNRLKRLLQDKKPKYLWFDETPYKQWLVKAANVQNFKWVCFDESKNIYRNNDEDSEETKKRIYKGEGTLEFSCFTPYAESRVTFLDDPVDSVWVWNREESPKRLIKKELIELQHKTYLLQTNETSPNNNQLYKYYIDNELIGEFEVYFTYEKEFSFINYLEITNLPSNVVKTVVPGDNSKKILSTFIDGNSETTDPYILLYYDGNKYYRILITYEGITETRTFEEISFSPITTLKPNLKYNYNFDEWKESSKLRNNIEPKIYNAGDVSTNTFISFTSQLKEKTTLSLYSSSSDLTNEVAKIILKPFELKGDDVGFIIDSKLKMIKGFKMSEDGKSRIITNNIYNKCHIGGDYFKIPVCADDEYYIIKSTSKNEFTVDYKHYYI